MLLLRTKYQIREPFNTILTDIKHVAVMLKRQISEVVSAHYLYLGFGVSLDFTKIRLSLLTFMLFTHFSMLFSF